MKSSLLSIAVFILIFASCRGTFEMGIEHPTPSTPPPTLAESPTVVHLPNPTKAPVPSNTTPSATGIDSVNAVKITIAPGTTASVMQGTIDGPEQVVTYSLEGKQSQPVILILSSPNNDLTLGIYEPDGRVLLDPKNKPTRWQGLLPRTEVYTIRVFAGALKEEYSLTAKVAQLVNFAPTASSVTVKGSTARGYVFSYAMNLNANQTMSASLDVPGGAAHLDIFGLSTGSFLNSVENAATWTGILPQTQAYVVEVIPDNGDVVDYSLVVSVNPTTGANIVMAPGTTASVVQGTIESGQVVTYKLEAKQSQPLILITNSINNDVTLGVYGPDGTVLLDPSYEWTRWQGLLPKAEVYKIQLTGGATTEEYNLTAKAAQPVDFAAGANSVTLKGSTMRGYLISYAVSANAGQTLTASLDVPSSAAYLDVFGLGSGVLLSSSEKDSSWTGVLPQTGYYVVEVIPNNGEVVDFSLTLSIH